MSPLGLPAKQRQQSPGARGGEKLKQLRRKYECLLTFKQREAIRLVYLENERDLSDAKIARKLKISLVSLKDRLSSALKDIRRQNPSFKFPERRRSSERAKVWKPSDIELDGLYRRSNSGPYPVRILDPKSLQIMEEVTPKDFGQFGFGEKRPRPNVDRQAIKQWALEMTNKPKPH